MLIFLFLYVAAQLGLAWAVSRRTKSEDDYLVAGRSLGPLLATFTVFATWFGAESCIGAAGAAYDEGLSGNHADPFGYSLCLLFMGIFFARKLWARKLSTLGDLYRQSYGARAEKLAVAVMIPGTVLWAAAQIRAFGQVLAASSDWSVPATVTFAAGAVIVYTCFGGLKADAVTDVVQGAMLIAGLAALGWMVLLGPGAAALRSLPTERTTLFPAGTNWLRHIENWAIPICGSLFAAELVARVAAARSRDLAGRASMAAAFGYFLLGGLVVTLGLAGSRIAPGLADGEQVLVTLASEFLPPVLFVVFTGALVSAILSTVDSNLLVAGSLVAHNVIIPWRRIRDERIKLLLNRAAVVLFGLIAYGLGLSADSVYDLVEEASAFGSAGLFVTALFALYSGVRSQTAAIVSLAGGAASYIGASHAGWPYPYLTSLAVAFAGFLAAARWAKDREIPSDRDARPHRDMVGTSER